MAAAPKLARRYTPRDPPLGSGAMGVVYRAWDTTEGREVAVKTLKEVTDPGLLDLFRRECEVLKRLAHPNIVDILAFDFEAEEPYFVMPLLEGKTLQQLIREASPRLTVTAVVDMFVDICRGLQQAHAKSIVHRDLKPSNIFVLNDDSVKIIDFGVAHLLDAQKTHGQKGTLLYMSPEVLAGERPTERSDLFSLGVVCYEALTLRHPFAGGSRDEIAHRIRFQSPAPAFEINPQVGFLLSQVIHAAMAKNPWLRYPSAKDFADCLRKAIRGEPIERFDPARVEPRVDTVRRALDKEDFDTAAKVLSALEAESLIHAGIADLRRQLDDAVTARKVRQHMESARKLFQEGELELALQETEEVRRLDPHQKEAVALEAEIRERWSAKERDRWLTLARRHIENHAWEPAREAARKVLESYDTDSQAQGIIAEVDRLQREELRAREEKKALCRSALEDWKRGEVSSAESKLQRVVELDRSFPDTEAQQQTARYQEWYENVRTEHDRMRADYNAARQNLDNRDFDSARALSQPWLERYPSSTLFLALQFAIEEEQQQAVSRYVAEVDAAVAAEPDLERKVKMLQEACSRYRVEHFETALARVTQRRDLVNTQVAKARGFEDRGQFNDALSQWDVVRTIYPFYPGLDVEVDRLRRRQKEKQRQEEKTRWVSRIEEALAEDDYSRAIDLVDKSLAEFPDDPELLTLRRTSQQRMERAREVAVLREEARKFAEQGQTTEAISVLRRARELNGHDPQVRSDLVESLVVAAQTALDANDWRSADALSQEALSLEASSVHARSLRTLVLDRKREELVGQCLSRARELQAGGDLNAALIEVETAIVNFGDEPQLRRLRDTLLSDIGVARSRQDRQRAIDAASELRRLAETEHQPGNLKKLYDDARNLCNRHPDIPELDAIVRDVETIYQTVISSAPPETDVPVGPAPAPRRDRRGPALAALPWKAWLEQVRANLRVLPLWAKAGGTVVLAAALIYLLVPKRGGTPGLVSVRLEVSPPDTSVTVDGNSANTSQPLSLTPGKHQLTASAEGYQPLSTEVEVSPATPDPYRVVLTPLPPSVTIESTVTAATIAVDDEPETPLEGLWRRDAVPAGAHRVKVTGARDTGVELQFELKPGSEPVLTAPSPREVQVVVLSSFRGKATLYASAAPFDVKWNGTPAGRVEAGGLRLPDVKAGTHTLTLGDGDTSRDLSADLAGGGPVLYAWIIEDRNTGDLRISANETDFKVFFGSAPQRTVKAGRFIDVRNLTPNDYTVRVVKEGYQEPQSQPVRIRKGGQATLKFNFVPLPATLKVVGLLPGTTVTFRNETITVPPSRGFERADVPVGIHEIVTRRKGYHDRKFARQFDKGKVVEVGPADMPQPLMGKVLIPPVTPPNAVLKIQCLKTEAPECLAPKEVPASPSREIPLQYGDFKFTYEAPGYEPEDRNPSVADSLVTPGAVTLTRKR